MFRLEYPRTALFLLAIACLLPFSNKAFHADDPLFIRTAQQIIKHPLDPYGFPIVWYEYQMPMSRVNQNPPLAGYYAALVGSVAGWSERALHLGFMLPALAVILGTYRLAGHFTQKPFLAAAATLLAPGFLVSATGVMCDTMMLAFWVLAVAFWMEGLEKPVKPLALALSSVLIAACALTKYFGVSLIPLLLVYSVLRKRRIGSWIGFLLIPVFLLGTYELWTHVLYGQGLLSFGLFYTAGRRKVDWAGVSVIGHVFLGLAFAGGCTLPVLTFAPFLWSRKQILASGALFIPLAFFLFNGRVNLEKSYLDSEWILKHWALVNSQMLIYIAGGVSLLALAVSDFWKKRTAASLLLLLWVVGTFCFAILVNWVVNARSLLPLIPAAAILIARRFDEIRGTSKALRRLAFVAPLVASGGVSLWVASGDMALANSARTMASYIRQATLNKPGAVEFEGHWGFQYYMESFGARPLERGEFGSHPGDIIVVPVNNTNPFKLYEKASITRVLEVNLRSHIATMGTELGAGFYSSVWGPLPFAIGPVPNERYYLVEAEKR